MIDHMPGIDGGNPLGFLAAVGIVTLAGGRLAWSADGGRWTPILHREDGPPLLSILVERLGIVHRTKKRTSRDVASNHVPSAYTLAQPACDDFKGSAKIPVASADILRAFLMSTTDLAEVERAVAHASVTVKPPEGGLEATAIRSVLAGGQIRYLRALRDIVLDTRPEHIREAVEGPWRYRSNSSKTSIDPDSDVENVGVEVTLLGAVSAIGAERLALEGIRSMPTSPSGNRLLTRGFSGRRPERLRWPLWEPPLSLDEIRMLFGSAGLHGINVRNWAHDVGVSAVLESVKYHKTKQYARLRRGRVIYEGTAPESASAEVVLEPTGGARAL